MTAHPSTSHADRITEIPQPDEPIPVVAWPTIALFAAAITAIGVSTTLGLAGVWPALASIPINALGSFAMFTVAHEASHAAASSHGKFNGWIGRIATPFFATIASFCVLRFVHMQHHRFTNRTDGSDPDSYTQSRHSWTLPLRWLTIDAHYLLFYVSRLGERPRREKAGLLVNVVLVVGSIATLCYLGLGFEVLVYYAVPVRVAIFMLAMTFDWLPHHGLTATADTNRFRTTRNIVGRERWITPLMLYQNYHLVHHLHPRIPFYRYIAVWRKNENAYLANDPMMTTPAGRPLTAVEYRMLRELERH